MGAKYAAAILGGRRCERRTQGYANSVRAKKPTGLLPAWHILMYMPKRTAQQMQRTAKIFMNNRSQAVRLPKEFQFRTHEVFIRKEGSEVVLSPRPFDWTSYLAEAPVASASFMEGVRGVPVQERDV
jgi:antitoxin VapB